MMVTVVAQLLDLGEDMTRQQDGGAVLGDFVNAGLKSLFHQRVQARGRLVEDVELGVGGERRDDRHLLPIALGVGAGFLVRVEFEPFDQLVAPMVVDRSITAQPCEEVDGLQAGQVGPQRDITGYVGDAPVQRHRVAPRVATE